MGGLVTAIWMANRKRAQLSFRLSVLFYVNPASTKAEVGTVIVFATEPVLLLLKFGQVKGK